MRIPRSQSRGRLLAAWILAAVWFSILPGVAPGLFATLAWVEGSHGIELQNQGDSMCVVLTHGSGNVCKSHEQIHQHRLLARVLVSISSPGDGRPDRRARG